jgi:hypothetical protein
VRLVGAASSLRQEIGAPMSPTEHIKLDELMVQAHEQMNESEQARAYGEGRSMSQDAAIRYSLEDQEST